MGRHARDRSHQADDIGSGFEHARERARISRSESEESMATEAQRVLVGDDTIGASSTELILSGGADQCSGQDNTTIVLLEV